MITKKISLYYSLTQTEVVPPAHENIESKDDWIKAVQQTVESPGKPAMIKVTYEVVDYEIERLKKFFEGPIVAYYAYQNENLTAGKVSPTTLAMYRETLLDEALGYDIQLKNRMVRRRKSTSDLRTTQRWNDLLAKIKEDLFDPSGYHFPVSEDFWELAKIHGYGKAKEVAIAQLQEGMLKRDPSKPLMIPWKKVWNN